jgi:hypothetical protein
MQSSKLFRVLGSTLLLAYSANVVAKSATAQTVPLTEDIEKDKSGFAALTTSQREALEASVERAARYLLRQQQPNGSFPSLPSGQPGVTSLCILSLLASGHNPHEGSFGKAIDRSLTYVLACQYEDGLLARYYPSMPMQSNNPSHTAIYNHAVAGLMLSEAYGMTRGNLNQEIHDAIESAIIYTRKRQLSPKKREGDLGGWRYVKPWPVSDSDLSITSWQLMFLRSAKNAGFDVPAKYIDDAMGYVQRCYEPEDGTFLYALYGSNRRSSRAMVGAGALALSLGGMHKTKAAQRAGEWILGHPFSNYNRQLTYHDRYFYGAFYCSHAMFQLGEPYWDKFYPTLVQAMVRYQNRDGSWGPERSLDSEYGTSYSTAMGILALVPPYQLLPIFQR